MTSHVRHRRTTVAGALPAVNLEPGELALNLADAKLFTSAAASSSPTSLLGVSNFQVTAKYALGDMVNHASMIWVAKAAVNPGPFTEAQWNKLSQADVANEINDALAAHVAATDPHPLYATDQDLINHLGGADPHPVYATDADLNAHKAAPDPYPQYTTTAEAQTIANAAAAAVQLPFTPVQQGGGPSQQGNKVNIGWSAPLTKLLVSVDYNGFSNMWPINAQYALAVLNGGGVGGTPLTFMWQDPGAGGAYVWSGDGPNNAFVRPVSTLRVANAANADAVNGVSGWAYHDEGNNPAYVWCTEGSGQAQHLTGTGNLRVSYANSANLCNTANDANHLLGQGVGYWLNNGSTAVVNIRNNGALQLIAGISGFGDVYWPVTICDERLKTDIAPSTEDSLAKIARIDFRQFRFKSSVPPPEGEEDAPPVRIDDGRLHRVGFIAQEIETIDPDWINNTGTYKQPDTTLLLMEALHAIKQLKREFDIYKAAHP
jgi:hypothetical protein